MTSSASSKCPACGKSASGRFCPSCGAAMAGRPCPSCGASLAPGARFCGGCGAGVGGGAAAPAVAAVSPAARTLWPFAVMGLAVIVALVAVLMPKQPVPAADTGPGLAAGGGAPEAPLPDLNALPARARFDTLYNRVMRASERGDQGTVAQFAPMALQAYAGLDAPDADARYHAAMVRLHTGDPTGAAALADTISQGQATHLFGFVIRGTVARLERDDARMAREQAAFLAVYDAEMAAARPEYNDHKFILDQFVGEARARVAAR